MLRSSAPHASWCMCLLTSAAFCLRSFAGGGHLLLGRPHWWLGHQCLPHARCAVVYLHATCAWAAVVCPGALLEECLMHAAWLPSRQVSCMCRMAAPASTTAHPAAAPRCRRLRPRHAAQGAGCRGAAAGATHIRCGACSQPVSLAMRRLQPACEVCHVQHQPIRYGGCYSAQPPLLYQHQLATPHLPQSPRSAACRWTSCRSLSSRPAVRVECSLMPCMLCLHASAGWFRSATRADGMSDCCCPPRSSIT